MKCPLETGKTPGILLEYPAGRLDPVVQIELEKHIAVCLDCQEAIEGQTAVWNALDAWEPAPVTTDFNRRLWQRIDQVEADRWFAVNWRPALPFAAALLLMVGTLIYQRPHERLPIQSVAGADRVTSTGVTLTEVDQVEAALDDLQLLQQLDSATVPDNDAASRI